MWISEWIGDTDRARGRRLMEKLKVKKLNKNSSKERKDKGRVSNGWECMGWKSGSSSFENCEANLGISRRVASWLDSLSSSFIIGRNYAICIEMEITSDFNGMLKAIDREIYPSHGFLGISVESDEFVSSETIRRSISMKEQFLLWIFAFCSKL